jgi:hypothetical protein
MGILLAPYALRMNVPYSIIDTTYRGNFIPGPHLRIFLYSK